MSVMDQILDGTITLEPSTKGSMNIVFTGDFYPGGYCEDLCRNGKYGDIYHNSLPVLKGSDIAVVNLESPLTTGHHPIEKDGPHLSADPICVNALPYAGFNVAALANNHILDHGMQGVRDTIAHCNEAGIKTVGAGLNQREAEQPLIIEVNSTKIGFLNVTENEFSIAKGDNPGANGLDLVSNYYQIMKLKKEADVIILIIHGGNELFPLPNPRMVSTYRFFADLGVTAIIGHHSHCASGFEVYNGVPIFYSLGNFIFESGDEPSDMWNNGYMVKLSVSRNSVSKISLYPYEQFKSKVGINLLDGQERIAFLRKIKEYSIIIQDSELLLESWDKFCNSNEGFYISSLFGLNKVARALVRRGIGKNLFIRNKALIRLLNQIRCEAHREASMYILQSNINRRKC
mgnify:CR=1 FL=1